MNECFAQVLLSEAAPRCGGNPFIIIFKKCFPPQRGATSANDMRKLGEPRGSLGEPPRKLLKSPGVVNCIIAARRNHQRTAREPPRTAKEPLGTAQEPLGPLGTARNRPGSAKEPTGTLRDRQGTARCPKPCPKTSKMGTHIRDTVPKSMISACVFQLNDLKTMPKNAENGNGVREHRSQTEPPGNRQGTARKPPGNRQGTAREPPGSPWEP